MQQLSKKFAAIVYVPLTLPSSLLFVFGFAQDPINWLFIGVGVAVLVFNALMLIAIYKWLLDMANSPVEESHGEDR